MKYQITYWRFNGMGMCNIAECFEAANEAEARAKFNEKHTSKIYPATSWAGKPPTIDQIARVK